MGHYVYNSDGLRVEKWAAAPSMTKTNYVWDVASPLPALLQETATVGSSTTTVKYVHGLDLISAVEGTAATYYLYDGLGSTRALADDQGTVTATYGYDVFGALRSSTGESEQAFRFTGDQQDADVSGLYYLRARYYDPATGRLLSKDPVPYLQRYAYAGNNPVNAVDPSGQTAAAPALILPVPVTAVALIGILSAVLMDCVMDNLDQAWIPDCQPILEQLRQAEADFMRGLLQLAPPPETTLRRGIIGLLVRKVKVRPRGQGERELRPAVCPTP